MKDWDPELYLKFKSDHREDGGGSRVGDLGRFFQKHDVLHPEEYYDILANCSSDFQIWETICGHALPSRRALIEWVRATLLRPYEEQLAPARGMDEATQPVSSCRDALYGRFRLCAAAVFLRGGAAVAFTFPCFGIEN